MCDGKSWSPWHGLALALALCASACGGAPEEALEAPLPESPVSAQGYERQGMKLKGLARPGYEQHGSEAGVTGVPVIQGFSLSSVAGMGYTVSRAELVQGTLQVRRSQLQGSTTSFMTCSVLSSTTGETRRCGWYSGGVGLCTPGTSVTVTTGACNVSGQEDTVLRVCSGASPCEYGSSGLLASNDDACGSLAARATFTCPASGSFTVMVAPYRDGTPLKAKPVALGANVYPYYNVLHTGAALNGTPLRAITRDGGSIPMRIKAVHDELPAPYVHPGRYGPGLTYRYEVEEQQADGQWVPLCGRDVDGGLNAAIPVSGWWDREGRHQEDPDLFTFSCGTGVVAKCYRWGYRPWDWHSAQGTGLTPRELHQACTRMARADYCGKGDSWTQPGTDINLWDLAGIQQQAATLPGHSFEAGWSAEGAVCLNQTRWSHTPNDVFFEGCPNLIDSFQVPGGGVQRVARVCGSMSEARAKSSRAALFDESAHNLFPGSSVPASY